MITFLSQVMIINKSEKFMELLHSLILHPRQNLPSQINSSENIPKSIKEQLQKLCTRKDESVKESYIVIEKIIEKQCRERGPKSFALLLDEVLSAMKKQILKLVLGYREEIAILNIIYGKKYLEPWLMPEQNVQLQLVSAIASIHMFIRTGTKQFLSSAFDKIGTLSKNYQKKKGECSQSLFLLLLLKGLTQFLNKQYKKAKYFLTKAFDQMYKFPTPMQRQTNILVISTAGMYYFKQLYVILKVNSLAEFYSHKFIEYCDSLPDGIGASLKQESRTIAKKMSHHQTLPMNQIKLTRIQNKLENLHLTRTKIRTKKSQSMIKNNKPSSLLEVDNDQKKMMEEELTNIFLIKDTKSTNYRLRKENIRYLSREQKKTSLGITEKKNQLDKVQKLSKKLPSEFRISQIQKQIQQLKESQENMEVDYQTLRERNFNKLKEVKTIQCYVKMMSESKNYNKIRLIHDFLYGKMLSRSKIFIMGRFFRRKIQMVKKMMQLRKITYKGILYFTEIFEIIRTSIEINILLRNKEPGIYFRIYPIQKLSQHHKSQAIIHEMKITKQMADKLCETPFYFHYQWMNTTFITWTEYFQRKSFMVVYYIQTFLRKFKCRQIAKINYSQIQKVKIKLSYGSKNSISLQTLVLVLVKKVNGKQESAINNTCLNLKSLEQMKYEAELCTIAGRKYPNQHYNIYISMKMRINTPTFSISKLRDIVEQSFVSNFDRDRKRIILIQNRMKIFYSKIQLNKIKAKTTVDVKIHGSVIYSLKKCFTGKTTLTVENIASNERDSVEIFFEINSFSLIEILKEKLSSINSCRDKIKTICKYARSKIFITKLKNHFRGAGKLTDFQVSFNNRIVFAKIYPFYMFEQKRVQGKIMVMLIVESLVEIPRPYILRIFSVQKYEDSEIIDIEKRIFHKDKKYYETHLSKLNVMINLTSTNDFEHISEETNTILKKILLKSKFISSNKNLKISQITNKPDSTSIIPKNISKKSNLLINYRNRSSMKFKSEFQTFKQTINLTESDQALSTNINQVGKSSQQYQQQS